jgi:hypothetical protein
LKCTVTPAARRSLTLRTELITSLASSSRQRTFHTRVSSVVLVGSLESARALGSVVGEFSCSSRLIAATVYQLRSLYKISIHLTNLTLAQRESHCEVELAPADKIHFMRCRSSRACEAQSETVNRKRDTVAASACACTYCHAAVVGDAARACPAPPRPSASRYLASPRPLKTGSLFAALPRSSTHLAHINHPLLPS